MTISEGELSKIHEHADDLGFNPETIVIGGISCGGTIGMYLTHRARDEDIKIAYAVFVVPVVDASVLDENSELRDDGPYPSWREMYDGPFLSYHRMSWFYRYYLTQKPSRELLRDPMLSPIHSKNFEGLPSCLIVTAEVDVLRDEGRAYHAKLVEAGVDAELKELKGVPHPFVGQSSELPQVREFEELVLERLSRHLRGK